MIEISEQQVDRVYMLLRGMYNGRGPTVALRNAINRGMITARSESAKAISETYRIKQKDFKAETKIKVFRSNQSVIEAGFIYAGNVIPLIKFQINPPKPVSGRRRKYTRVSVMKENGATELVDAYVANLGRYGDGVFERLTSKRESSQQLYGPSAAHMAGNESIYERVSEKAQEMFDERVEHEIGRILNGYWGRYRF